MKHSQQQHSNHQQRQHPDYRRGSSIATPTKSKPRTSVVVTRSRILSFHVEKVRDPKNNAFARPLPGTTSKVRPWDFTFTSRKRGFHTPPLVPKIIEPRLKGSLVAVREEARDQLSGPSARWRTGGALVPVGQANRD